MPSKREDLLIYGASGHAKVVIDAVERQGRYKLLGLLDDNPKLHQQGCFGYPVLGGIERLSRRLYKHCKLLLAVGSNEARCKLAERLRAMEREFGLVVHPSAQISRGVRLRAGTVVMAGVIVNADSHLGEHVILNTGATVDHDCVIGDFVHIAPGAHIAGGVRVGRLSLIGIGVSVIPGVRIGEGAVIGAGAAVVEDVPDHVTAVGVPARIVQQPHARK